MHVLKLYQATWAILWWPLKWPNHLVQMDHYFVAVRSHIIVLNRTKKKNTKHEIVKQFRTCWMSCRVWNEFQVNLIGAISPVRCIEINEFCLQTKKTHTQHQLTSEKQIFVFETISTQMAIYFLSEFNFVSCLLHNITLNSGRNVVATEPAIECTYQTDNFFVRDNFCVRTTQISPINRLITKCWWQKKSNIQ